MIKLTWTEPSLRPPTVTCVRKALPGDDIFLSLALIDSDYPAPHLRSPGPARLLYLKVNVPCGAKAHGRATAHSRARELLRFSLGDVIAPHLPHRYRIVLFAHRKRLDLEVPPLRDATSLVAFAKRHRMRCLETWNYFFAPLMGQQE